MRIISVISLAATLYSCCPFTKEERLGNNLYLSEYDNEDRRILYSAKSCSGDGMEIVPMTVVEYKYDSEWVIAKSKGKRDDSVEYWIIKNNLSNDPTVELIHSNTTGPLSPDQFSKLLIDNQIRLKLRKIE